MKGKLFPPFWAVICFLVMTVSCATTTLKSAWMDSAYKGGPLKNVLIIGIDRNPTVRELLEDEFAEQLKARGTAAVPSHTILSEEEILDKGTIVSKMKERGIDSVLVVSVADVKAMGTYESYPPYSSIGDFATDYLACCQYVSVGRDVFIKTGIFDAKYDKLIWSALSETIVEAPSLRFSIESFVLAVTKDLRNKKLLK
jgi:hypothetical protein